MRRVLSCLFLGSALLAVSACGGQTTAKAEDKLDERLLGKGDADPVLTSALEDQIMVDPSLSNMANRNAVKAADAPMTAPVPPETTGPSAAAERSAANVTLGQLASKQAAAARDKFTGCGLDVGYSMQWATRLPADIPLYPRARVDEAAGSDMPGCKLRAVTFTTPAPQRAVIDFYIGQSKRSGFASSTEVKGRETLVGGTRGDGAAYYVVVTPAEAGGTIVDLVLNNGV